MTITVSHDEIAQILTTLKTQGIQSVALTTIEGRSLGSTVSEAGARFKLGALSAASVAIATKTSGELGLGNFDQVHIICGGGALLLGAVGPKALLSVVTDNGVDFPQLFREMRRVASQLAKFVQV
jgi:predicted regulator of Ras-like GTPase activity (Roadblock/LC7/MglB family)